MFVRSPITTQSIYWQFIWYDQQILVMAGIYCEDGGTEGKWKGQMLKEKVTESNYNVFIS